MIGSPELPHWIGLLLFWSTLFLLEGSEGHEISGCFGDTVTISCGPGERKINILGDFYGLSPPDAKPKVCAYSDRDVCVVPSHSHSSVAKQVCNGRSNCIFTISEKHTCTNTDQETTYQQIKYECIPESKIRSMCTEQEWSSHSGFLTSANYPIFYPPRASCTCTLRTADDSFILLKTAELRLKASSPCRDYLQVEPLSNPEEQLCGTVHRLYEARRFTLYFHTQLTSYKGFMLSYEATSPVTIRCFRGRPHTTTLPTTTQNVTSPTASHHDVDVRHPNQDASANTKRNQSPKQNPRPSLTSEKQGPWRRTKGDRQSGTGGTKKGPRPGSTVSPSVKAPVRPALHSVSGCFGDIVHFQCKGGEMIRVVKDLYGSAPVGRCSYKEGDCVVKAEGQKSIVSQICSSKTRCMNFIVTRMFCEERVTSYQEIYYECVPATALTNVCTETVITSSEGYLASPNFPGMYPRNLSCSCTLRAAPRIATSTSSSPASWLRLDMAHFALHDIQGCGDWLELDVEDGNPPKRLCGSQHGVFSGRSVQLTFTSDTKYSHSGFWFHFKGGNGSQVVIACNVPVQSVWPTTSTATPSTTSTTPTPVSTRPIPSPTQTTITATTATTTQTTLMSVGGNSMISGKSQSSQSSENAFNDHHLFSPERSSPPLDQSHLDDVIGTDENFNGGIEEPDFKVVREASWEEGLSIEDEITTDEMRPIDEELPEVVSETEPEVRAVVPPMGAARSDPQTTVKPAKKQPVSSSADHVTPVLQGWTVLAVVLLIPTLLLAHRSALYN